MKLIRFLIHTNCYIALGAVFLALETQVQLGIGFAWHSYLWIIFFATLLDYNFHRFITLLTSDDSSITSKHKWVINNKKLFYFITALSAIGFFFSIIQTKWEITIAIIPLGLVTLFYTLPFFRTSKSTHRLRDLPGLKIFLIAFVWSAVTVYLPVIDSGINVNKAHLFLIFFERFIFVIAITIPFDIRDFEADRNSGLKTIPLIFGIQKSINIANILIITFILICIFHYVKFDLIFLLPALILSTLSTLYFLNSTKMQKSPLYYYGILDGTILLQGILVCASTI